MALRKINGNFYYYWVDAQGQHTRSLHTKNEKTARKRHADCQAIRADTKLRALYQEMSGGVKPINHPGALPVPTGIVASQTTTSDKRINQTRLKISDMWALASSRRSLSATHDKIWASFITRSGLIFADEVTPETALEYLNKNYGEHSPKTFRTYP